MTKYKEEIEKAFRKALKLSKEKNIRHVILPPEKKDFCFMGSMCVLHGKRIIYVVPQYLKARWKSPVKVWIGEKLMETYDTPKHISFLDYTTRKFLHEIAHIKKPVNKFKDRYQSEKYAEFYANKFIKNDYLTYNTLSWYFFTDADLKDSEKYNPLRKKRRK